MPIPCPFTLPPGATASNHELAGGVQWRILDASGEMFASVVCHSFSHGGRTGLWEIAAICDGEIDYDTEAVGGDVLGYCNVDKVAETLAALAVAYGGPESDPVMAQWERDHQAVTAWMDGQP